MDQGRQVRGHVDASVVLELQGQSRSVATVRPRLQPRQLLGLAGAAEVGEALLVDPGAPGLWETLIKIGAKVVWHARYVTFQMAEVGVPRELVATALDRILRFGVPSPLVQCARAIAEAASRTGEEAREAAARPKAANARAL